jgi:hypothetical protein
MTKSRKLVGKEKWPLEFMNRNRIHSDTVAGIRSKLADLSGQEKIEYLLGILDGTGLWANLTATESSVAELVAFRDWALAEQQECYDEKHKPLIS